MGKGIVGEIGRGVDGLQLEAAVDGPHEASGVAGDLLVGELLPGGEIGRLRDVDHDAC